MSGDARDPLADALWRGGAALLGAGLLGAFVAGGAGALAGVVLVSVVTSVLLLARKVCRR